MTLGKSDWYEYRDGVLFFDSLDRIKFEEPYYSLDLRKSIQADIFNDPDPVHLAQTQLAFVEEVPIEIKTVEIPKFTYMEVPTIEEAKEEAPVANEKQQQAIQILETWVDYFRGTLDSDDLISKNFNLPGQFPVAEVLQTYSDDLRSGWDNDFYIPSSWC